MTAGQRAERLVQCVFAKGAAASGALRSAAPHLRDVSRRRGAQVPAICAAMSEVMQTGVAERMLFTSLATTAAADVVEG